MFEQNYMASKKTPTAAWVLRGYVILLSIQYFFFCNTPSDLDKYFRRALIANAVVCALRLHQRVPEFGLSRYRLGLIVQEDSAHYLIYSIIFLMSHPLSSALLPVLLFAVIHASSYTRQLIDMHGCGSYPLLRKLINHVASQQGSLFRMVALIEAILFPMLLYMFCWSQTRVVAIALYYKFLHYRYLSKRNPYSRIVFFELRMLLEQVTNCQTSIFGGFSPIIRAIVGFVCLLGPRVTPIDEDE